MLIPHENHNRFRVNIDDFYQNDPHLRALSQLRYQHSPEWWQELSIDTPGIYILTGGRQVGKSTSCKLLIKHYLKNKFFSPNQIYYLPCDEIFDAKELSRQIREFLESVPNQHFLLVVDEVTYVQHWERVIKSLADEGYFNHGLCILTGSDSLILKEAAMSFPGRRGNAAKTDYHLYPLSFFQYVNLIKSDDLPTLFQHYLQSGGYLRAINDFAVSNTISPATYNTYEQWIRGDFLKHGKNENYLLNLLSALTTLGVSPISFSALTHKIGLMSKETCIDYTMLFERMDVLFDLQAFDQNKKQGFPRKDRKFHFLDPFIQHTIYRWLTREGHQIATNLESTLVEACVASHCHRYGKAFYFKGQGEIDVIWVTEKNVYPIEVKWSNQIRSNDLRMLKQFTNSIILGKENRIGFIDNIQMKPVYQFLYELGT